MTSKEKHDTCVNCGGLVGADGYALGGEVAPDDEPDTDPGAEPASDEAADPATKPLKASLLAFALKRGTQP